MHSVAAIALYAPTAQRRHAAAAPTDVEKLPGRHAVHADADAAVAKEPAAHGRQAVAADDEEKVPAGHGTHADAAAPAPYEPLGQRSHTTVRPGVAV